MVVIHIDRCARFHVDRTKINLVISENVRPRPPPLSESLRNLGLAVNRSRTTQGSLSLSILGANMWNGLSHTLKEHRHKMCFKKILVKSYVANYRN